MQNMAIDQFIRLMPKVELHVHLEGAIKPSTLLILAQRNNVSLPANSLSALQDWYRFSDFDHFIEVYFAICNCIRTPQDFELITAEFLKTQAEQNIKYSEVIFTPFTHHAHVPFDQQLAAINHARMQAEAKLGVQMALVPDISRHIRPAQASIQIAHWAADNRQNSIYALGLGGPEIGNPPELFKAAFQHAKTAGLASLPHAGETQGPPSIWGALNALSADRIGHGIRCLEDPELVRYLRRNQIPLDVCPSSNVRLGVVPSLAQHPLPKLLDEGLLVTINSDDPPMFDTSLTDEYHRIVEAFGFDTHDIIRFVINGIRASLLPPMQKRALERDFQTQFTVLQKGLGR
jgi:adenosine deaminase